MAESSLTRDLKLFLWFKNLQGFEQMEAHGGCEICWDGHIRVHSKECTFQHKSIMPQDTRGIGRGLGDVFG